MILGTTVKAVRKRLHLATRKDITNIENAFGLRRAERHKNDATSVVTVVKEMMVSESSPVLIYKPQGSRSTQESPSLRNNYFILALTHSYKQRCWKNLVQLLFAWITHMEQTAMTSHLSQY